MTDTYRSVLLPKLTGPKARVYDVVPDNPAARVTTIDVARRLKISENYAARWLTELLEEGAIDRVKDPGPIPANTGRRRWLWFRPEA